MRQLHFSDAQRNVLLETEFLLLNTNLLQTLLKAYTLLLNSILFLNTLIKVFYMSRPQGCYNEYWRCNLKGL